ncbi:MAG: hypothetical protein KBT12_07890, partial [Bacteroidales bacterium]|nr:hypothetical protein [Candidatus Physcousia equi]
QLFPIIHLQSMRHIRHPLQSHAIEKHQVLRLRLCPITQQLHHLHTILPDISNSFCCTYAQQKHYQ